MLKNKAKSILSVLLALTVCLTAFLGCIITANAEVPSNQYSVEGEPVAAGERTATAYVTFSPAYSITEGKFDLMFDENIRDVRNADVDTNGDGVILKYAVDENGNLIKESDDSYKLSGDVINNTGLMLPNVVERVDGEDIYYNTAIELYSGVKENGTTVMGDDLKADFATGKTETEKTYIGDSADKPSDYTTYANSVNRGTADDYKRFYFDKGVSVVTPSLSYDIATVTEDSYNLLPGETHYAEGFKNIYFKTSTKYKSITFKVTFDFSGRTDRLSIKYPDLQSDRKDCRYSSDNYVFYGNYDLELEVIETIEGTSTFQSWKDNSKIPYFHVHQYSIAKANKLNQDNNDAYVGIYTGRCGCGQEKTMIATDDMPFVANDSGNLFYAFNNFRGIYGMNIVYNTDGSCSLNIHVPTDFGTNEKLLISDENGNLVSYSETIESTQKYDRNPSFFATVKDENGNFVKNLLTSEAKMITIKNIPARDITKTFYVARYTPATSSETQLMGNTYKVSLADYLNQVINGGENVYYNDNSVTEINNDKQVAASLLNYAFASKTALAQTKDETNIIYLDGDGNDTDWKNNGTGSKADPYIISNTSQLRNVIEKFDYEYRDKYFKIADGIDIISLQSKESLKKMFNSNSEVTALNSLMKLSGYAEVKEKFETAIEKNAVSRWNSSGSKYFDAHIDFNGATVYGMYNTSGGLIANAGPNAEIKNLKVKNSYVSTQDYAGAVVGCIWDYDYNNQWNNSGTVFFENIEISNCFIQTVVHNTDRVGVLFGMSRTYNSTHGQGFSTLTATVNNCLVYGCKATNTNPNENNQVNDWDCLFGSIANLSPTSETAGINNQFENMILIGVTPYNAKASTDLGQITLPDNFNNVYTTKTEPTPWAILEQNNSLYKDITWDSYKNKITQISEADALGETAKTTCSALDWANTWVAGATADDYPTLANPDAGAVEKQVVYWDGKTATQPTTTDNKGNTLITSAEELYWVVREGGNGNYKVADNIGTIVLQTKDNVTAAGGLNALMNLDANGVIDWFDDLNKDFVQTTVDGATKSTMTFDKTKTVNGNTITWSQWSSSKSQFTGTFDGNGATVYGMLTLDYIHGLFGQVNGATIKNISIASSYAYGDMGSLLVGRNDGENADYIESCSVTNSCLIASRNKSYSWDGILIGVTKTVFNIKNCFVADNIAKHQDDKAAKNTLGLVGDAPNVSENEVKHSVSNSIVLGIVPYAVNNQLYYGLGFNGYFSNVYTDAQSGTVTFDNKNGKGENYTQTYTDAQIKHIDPADVKGTNAQTIVNALNSANGSTVWYASNYGDYPSFKENAMPAAYQSAYEQITFDSVNDYGTSTADFGVYRTSITLYNNPYMSVTFMFGKQYRDNLKDVSISLYKADGTTLIKTLPTLDKAKDDIFSSYSGWTHNQGAGRYYLYRITDIAVKDLCKLIVIKMTYGEETVTSTVSVAGLGTEFETAYRTNPSTYYSTRVDAVKALMFYAQSVNARYGTNA